MKAVVLVFNYGFANAVPYSVCSHTPMKKDLFSLKRLISGEIVDILLNES